MHRLLALGLLFVAGCGSSDESSAPAAPDLLRSGTPARSFAANFDSLWLDLTKGLGAPVGAVLAG